MPIKTGDMMIANVASETNKYVVCTDGVLCRMTTAAQLAAFDAETLTCDGANYTANWTTPTTNLCGEDFPWFWFDNTTSDSDQTAYWEAFAGEQLPFTTGDNLVSGAITYSEYDTGYTEVGITFINMDGETSDYFFGWECMEFDDTVDYTQWETACDTITQEIEISLLYECYADAGCPASSDGNGIYYWDDSSDAAAADVSPTWLTRDGWRLTRNVGVIVTDYTTVDAWEYYDWAPAIEGDVVFVDEELYECVHEFLCESVLPYLAVDQTVWSPSQGIIGEALEFTESEPIDALPMWMYAMYVDYVSLDSSDYFQFAGKVFQCPDYTTDYDACEDILYYMEYTYCAGGGYCGYSYYDIGTT
jgi:hypothetical protein